MAERKVHVGIMVIFPEGVGPGGEIEAGIAEAADLDALRTGVGRRNLVEKIAAQLDTLLDEAGIKPE